MGGRNAGDIIFPGIPIGGRMKGIPIGGGPRYMPPGGIPMGGIGIPNGGGQAIAAVP